MQPRGVTGCPLVHVSGEVHHHYLKPPTRAPDPLVSDVDMKTVDPTEWAVGGVEVPHPKLGVRLVPT